MGLHSTIFGPVKYSILPQHLQLEELVGGNGLVEMGTFLAILLGTVLGGVLIAQENSAMSVSVTVIAIACAGYLASRGVPSAPPAAPDLKIQLEPVHRNVGKSAIYAQAPRSVSLGARHFVVLVLRARLCLRSFRTTARTCWAATSMSRRVMLTTFSIGVGAGSLLCERLSGHKVEIGLVPFGSIGLTLFALDLYFASPAAAPGLTIGAVEFLAQSANWRILFDLVMIGMFGGFYIVPLYALIQTRAERSHQIAHHRGQQHPQCLVHGRLRIDGDRVAESRYHHSADIPRHCAAERRGRGLHLHAGAGIPDAVPGLAADAFDLPPRYDRHRQYSGRRAGGAGVQPREFCRRADHRRGMPAADPFS